VNKGRYVWLGIGLRADGTPPDDGHLGSLGEPSAEEGSPRKSGVDKRQTTDAQSYGEPSEAKNQNFQGQNPREEQDVDSGFTRFTGFTPRATDLVKALKQLFEMHPEVRRQPPERMAQDLYIWTDLGYEPTTEEVAQALQEAGL
jgi:hypothetical protein